MYTNIYAIQELRRLLSLFLLRLVIKNQHLFSLIYYIHLLYDNWSAQHTRNLRARVVKLLWWTNVVTYYVLRVDFPYNLCIYLILRSKWVQKNFLIYRSTMLQNWNVFWHYYIGYYACGFSSKFYSIIIFSLVWHCVSIARTDYILCSIY